MLKIGDRVFTVGDPQHVGTVEKIGEEGMVTVRWHKGYATWEPIIKLKKDANDKA